MALGPLAMVTCANTSPLIYNSTWKLRSQLSFGSGEGGERQDPSDSHLKPFLMEQAALRCIIIMSKAPLWSAVCPWAKVALCHIKQSVCLFPGDWCCSEKHAAEDMAVGGWGRICMVQFVPLGLQVFQTWYSYRFTFGFWNLCLTTLLIWEWEEISSRILTCNGYKYCYLVLVVIELKALSPLEPRWISCIVFPCLRPKLHYIWVVRGAREMILAQLWIGGQQWSSLTLSWTLTPKRTKQM